MQFSLSQFKLEQRRIQSWFSDPSMSQLAGSELPSVATPSPLEADKALSGVTSHDYNPLGLLYYIYLDRTVEVGFMALLGDPNPLEPFLLKSRSKNWLICTVYLYGFK